MDPENMEKEILFLFGPARGGTTYLNNLLSRWFSVGTAPEGTFIGPAVHYGKKLGDLSDQKNKQLLAEYIVDCAPFQIMRERWREQNRIDVRPSDIIERMSQDTIADAIYASFLAIAELRKKNRVGNKNPGYWRELDLLHELFPDSAKYLFIIRDGRDVFLSLGNQGWGHQTAYEAAMEYRHMVQTVNNFRSKVPSHRFLCIRYEDLLAQPDRAFTEIGNFLGQSDLQTLRDEFLRESTNNAKNNNYGKWKSRMSAKDLKTYEAAAARSLQAHGYETRYPERDFGFLARRYYGTRRIMRLAKVNIYHALRDRPIDKISWRERLRGHKGMMGFVEKAKSENPP